MRFPSRRRLNLHRHNDNFSKTGLLARDVSGAIGLDTETHADPKAKKAGQNLWTKDEGLTRKRTEREFAVLQAIPTMVRNIQMTIRLGKTHAGFPGTSEMLLPIQVCGHARAAIKMFQDRFKKSIKASPRFNVFNFAVEITAIAETGRHEDIRSIVGFLERNAGDVVLK
ncbi:uncharacterized protein PAC_13935 [Phialocephala subalpina]|uniref:Uncharacterized protein n=1 Tax=Phialocephala subalpina TaxID=576137 RepID=A0A1L7XGA5_9HELO|nr:uncharacterized protein PAC_13935 [Phialocephala subalpina]